MFKIILIDCVGWLVLIVMKFLDYLIVFFDRVLKLGWFGWFIIIRGFVNFLICIIWLFIVNEVFDMDWLVMVMLGKVRVEFCVFNILLVFKICLFLFLKKWVGW